MAADDPVGPPIGDDFDVAIPVRAVHRQPEHLLQAVEGGPMRVAVLVVDAGRNDGHGGLDDGQERTGRPRVGPVVADLQHVDRAQQPPLGKQRLDGRLRVPSEQSAETAIAQEANDGCVVDVAIRHWAGDVVGRRKEDLELRPASERDDLAGASRRHAGARLVLGGGQHLLVRLSVRRSPAVHDQAHLVPAQDLAQSSQVVLVRVGQDHDLDSPLVERQSLADPPHGQVRIHAGVDQGGAPIRRLDQDRVALADVEHGQVQPAIRPGQDGGHGEDQHQAGRRASGS
ncbi:MAG: hypothetical protein WEI16_04575, partial [Chloroflexota bacterium]